MTDTCLATEPATLKNFFKNLLGSPGILLSMDTLIIITALDYLVPVAMFLNYYYHVYFEPWLLFFQQDCYTKTYLPNTDSTMDHRWLLFVCVLTDILVISKPLHIHVM